MAEKQAPPLDGRAGLSKASNAVIRDVARGLLWLAVMVVIIALL
jgi:hypothetical protein